VPSAKAEPKREPERYHEVLRVRPGTPRDVPAILALIRGLAEYERLTRHLRLSARRLRRHGFGRRRYFESLICTLRGRPIGCAVYYFNYSTFTCSPVLFIEDIFVVPEERGRGAGNAMMAALARIAVKRGCHQMEWIVLDWNKPSIDFYHKLGARLDKTWVLTRLTDARLRRLAGRG
jgi:GNAT superfamily N-acetyltransferase